jgi:hypothetical protein
MVDGFRSAAVIIDLYVLRSTADAALRLLCWFTAATILAASRDNLRWRASIIFHLRIAVTEVPRFCSL